MGLPLDAHRAKVGDRQLIKQYACNDTFEHHFLDGTKVEVAKMMVKFINKYREVDSIGVVGIWQINKG